MPLYSTLASLSQTAASNAADGAVDAPSTIDQQTNLLASFIAQLRDGVGTNYQLGPRNLLINPTGVVNQRGYVTGAATGAANTYTLDRWRVVTSGQSVAFGAPGPDRTMTAPAGGLEQVIENLSVIGGVYTLSWSGTATATVNGVAIANGGQTASLSANNNVTVSFFNGTVLRPQFELGTVATPFERRPIGLETALCLRYYQTGFASTEGYNLAGSVNRGTAYFQGPMRTTPTIVPTFAYGNMSSGSVDQAGSTYFRYGAVVTSNGSAVMQLNFTASAEL